MGLPPPNPDFNFSSILPRDITSNLDKTKDLLGKQGSSILGDAAQAFKDPKAALANLQKNITSTINDGKKALDSAAGKIKDGAKNATSEIVSTFINETISTLDIHDFYTAHLTTWCEGMYKDGKSKKDVTYCSNGAKKNSTSNSTSTKHDGPFGFIDDMHLPDPIALAMGAITLLSKLISGLYAIALLCIFIAIITSGFSATHGFFPIVRIGGSPRFRKASLVCTILAFLFLLLGVILAKLLAQKVVDKFTGQHIGLQAQMGNTFMNVSIAACAFAGAAAAVAVADWRIGKAMESGKGFGKKVVGRLWYGMKKGRKEKEQHYYETEDEYEMEQAAGQKY